MSIHIKQLKKMVFQLKYGYFSNNKSCTLNFYYDEAARSDYREPLILS